MSEKNDGGQAFPAPLTLTVDGRLEFPLEGMTLREYYAGQAMLGILANPEGIVGATSTAQFSVIQADALIDELEKDRGET